MARVAVIDIGTFTTRLAIADVVDGRIEHLEKDSTITDLGEGVAESGRLASAAIERVVTCASSYVKRAREGGAQACVTTLTSAARDAENADDLLGPLRDLGLEPQVIPGEVEGSLTFCGVAQDAPGQTVLVADSGGGSTELALGMLGASGLNLADVRSLNVGCRRITDLFLSRNDPPAADDIVEARAWAAEIFAPNAAEQLSLAIPAQLFTVGGTATTLVAIQLGLVPYDGSRVHLHGISRAEVDELVMRLASKPLADRAGVPGIQAKRASVIVGGAIVLSELMRAFDLPQMVVSEHDLLYGLAVSAGCAAEGVPAPLPWEPMLSRLA